jgi:5-methyltetrahydrofolate--homocysteine methyltransferase
MLDRTGGARRRPSLHTVTKVRGERFCDHGCDLAGNNELLTLTQPDAMREIHLRYFLAGADIAETNTFSANRVSQADYDTVDQVVELNEVAARLAREAAEEATASTVAAASSPAPSARPT